ncbi:MAG: hypothetical protein CMJ85_13215 [Planctomycetes bacterium]|jgi:YHS domain-containing protein|nr:hypothetical protein [Planctomycetota bacterium]MDP6424910.1 c-type cytochrome domain-containing protein [Planctomycetota bacterium]
MRYPILGVIVFASCFPMPELAAQKKVDFVKEVLPIFMKRCSECHGAEEQEGDLRLDIKASVFSEEHSDPIILAGKPDRSMLYRRIVLDKDDPDIMPAEGDPLSKRQIATIKRWIKEGADWPDAASAKVEPEKSPQPVEVAVPDIDDAGKAALAALRKRGATAVRVSARSNAVYVNFSLLAKGAKDADVRAMRGLEPQLVWLNLGRTAITDEGVAELARYKELRRLHLEKTAVTDGALAHLAGLEHLEYLNVYGTAVSDRGIGALAPLKGLQKLYVWQSKVTAKGAAVLKKQLPQLVVDRGDYVAAIRKVTAEQKAAAPVNDMCPMMPKRKAVLTAVFVYEGERIAFCCEKCLARFAKSPDKFLPKLRRKKPGKTVKDTVNETCPFVDKPIKPGVVAVYKGKRIGFCCFNCRDKFAANPQKFAKVLEKFGLK